MTATIWQRAGLMLINIDHDAKKMAAMTYAAGFRAVFPMSHHGTQRKDVEKLRQYLIPYRDLGFKIGTWGYLSGKASPEGEASTAWWFSKVLNADFYVGNPEIEYKYTGGEGNARCSFCFERSMRFCNQFQLLAPGFPIGVSSYGRFDQADLHWAAWNNVLRARALPQAYMNEQGPSWAPKECFKGAIDVKQPHNVMNHPKTGKPIPGFPKSYVHVSIAKPDPNDSFKYTMQDWIDALVAARAVGHPLGFSVYEAENVTAADYALLGQAIRTHKLAALS